MRAGGKYSTEKVIITYTDPIRTDTDPIRARYEPYTDVCRPHTVRVWANAEPMRTDTDPIRARYGASRDRCRLHTVRIRAHTARVRNPYGPLPPLQQALVISLFFNFVGRQTYIQFSTGGRAVTTTNVFYPLFEDMSSEMSVLF